MNFKDLNDIENEKQDFLNKAKRLDNKSEHLAMLRNNMVTLHSFINSFRANDSNYLLEIQQEVLSVINPMSHDVFRAVEMKFAAEARQLRIEAKLKNQQLENYFTENEVK